MSTSDDDLSIDWPSRFRRGDVVRRADAIAVVIEVSDTSENGDPPTYALVVDAAWHGEPNGIAFWDPSDATLCNDDASRAEARGLDLRGLD